MIFEALDEIKIIEANSNLLTQGYKGNVNLLKDIGSDQDDILRTLNDIERQLDKLLSEGPDHKSIGSNVAFFNNPLLTPDNAFYETKGVRHQVFEKSYKLSQDIEEIS